MDGGFTGFEWDRQKNARNVQERGLDFATAIRVFASPHIEYDDDREDYGEDRHIVVGRVECAFRTLILVVVWTPRGAKRRIISARPAEDYEKEVYRNSCGGV